MRNLKNRLCEIQIHLENRRDVSLVHQILDKDFVMTPEFEAKLLGFTERLKNLSTTLDCEIGEEMRDIAIEINRFLDEERIKDVNSIGTNEDNSDAGCNCSCGCSCIGMAE